MAVELENRLLAINRQFVHRLNGKGYLNFDDLLEEMQAAEDIAPTDAAGSEYWLRIANDMADYIDEWQRPLNIVHLVDFLGRLETQLIALSGNFTQTQKMRLASIADRTRTTLVNSDNSDEVLKVYEKLLASTGGSLSL